jgi:glycosyltransferase involved in cell wall biosynthesis
MPNWVRLCGEMPASEVRQLWANHDLFAMPTWFEPFGLVFLEARAAGVPILARDAFCMPELVPEESGRLIPADGGVDAVAELLLSMSQDADLFASAAKVAETTRTQCTWETVADSVTRLIRSSLAVR